MSRSVSYPLREGTLVAYQDCSGIEDHLEFDDYLGDLRNQVQARWKSFYDCDVWLDREDHAVLQNDLVYFGVSEYCGLVAVWVTPKEFDDREDYTGLAFNFINQITPRFLKTFGTLRKVATFSNGETVYERRGEWLSESKNE